MIWCVTEEEGTEWIIRAAHPRPSRMDGKGWERSTEERDVRKPMAVQTIDI